MRDKLKFIPLNDKESQTEKQSTKTERTCTKCKMMLDDIMHFWCNNMDCPVQKKISF